MAGGTRTGVSRSVAAYASLVRVPNLFTAPPDVILGAALAAGAGRSVPPAAVAGLALSSTLLYAAGTALNDAFDAPEDAEERPERPIPSGRVSRTAGFGLGAGLLVVGVGVAGVMAGVEGGAVAAALAVVVVLYDGALKGGTAGFLAMGATRGLNVGLGATAAGAFPTALPESALVVPVVVGVYIAAVTGMAASEVEGGNRTGVVAAGASAVLAAATVAWRLATIRTSAIAATLGVALAVWFLAWTGRALRSAYEEPTPEAVGRAVGACVVGLVVLDAAFAAGTGAVWAVAALAFLAPAIGLSRAFEVT